MADISRVFKDGYLVDINIGYWSGAKMLSPEDLGLKKEDVADAFFLGRKMLVPREVIRRFRTIEAQARRRVELKSFPFPLGGARFIPKKAFLELVSELDNDKAAFMALVDDLVTKYEQYRLEMRPVYLEAAEKAYAKNAPSQIEGSLESDFLTLKQEFIDAFMARIDSYYPPAESLRRKFSLDWAVYVTAAPEMNESGDAVATEEARRTAEQAYFSKVNTFADEVVKQLREETMKVCLKISSALAEGKVIKSSTINSLRNFIDRYKTLNFVGDKGLEDQLDALKSHLLDTHSETVIGKDTGLREELGRHMTLIAEVAGKIAETDISEVTGEYNRQIDLD